MCNVSKFGYVLYHVQLTRQNAQPVMHAPELCMVIPCYL